MIKLYLTASSLTLSMVCLSQHQIKGELHENLQSIYGSANPLNETFIIKTNVLSFVAKRPTISIEKIFSKKLSLEFSYVQGQFDNIGFTDHYHYSGFLVRARRYFSDLAYNALLPYAGIYAAR